MDVAEDVRRIGVQGFAGDQFVSLYRYYKKLTTAPGQAVSYSETEVSLLNSIRLGMFVKSDVVAGILGKSRLSAELATDVGVSPADGSAASVLPRGAPLIVTGHSLGGHLALLFGRFFPDVAEHVYTYNAPGIGLQGELALRLLGIPPAQPSQVTNVASVMGEEAISRVWSKPGENIGVFTETGSLLYQHSIVPLTDSLALHGAFGTLSPGLTGDPAAVSGIISAASPYSEDSLEVVLDALRVTLGVGGAPTLIARDLSDLPARDDYYQNLYALLDGRSPGRDYRIESLAGKSVGELAAMADSDVSTRFALKMLTPFAARGADYSSFEDAFSGQWLASRAEWLAARLEGNQADRVFGFSGTGDNVLFRDADAELAYAKLDGTQGNLAVPISTLTDRGRIWQFLDAVPYNRSVVFGSDAPDRGDQLLGLSGSDRLFGAAGDDRLDGAGGDDYLEGGPGGDTLIGGGGDDVLVGGAGVDRLEGGPGNDTYLFAEVPDSDAIVDRDGQVYAGSVLLTGGSGTRGGPYVSGDGRFSYEFSGDLASGGTLVINGALRIEGFHNGDLGIRLVDGSEPDAWMPATDTVLLGDFIYLPVPVSPTEIIWLDAYGNPRPETRGAAVPGQDDVDTQFPGTPGNTHFIMGGGNDLAQDRLGGDDRIELGSGDDNGFGGMGNDVVEGGPGRDIVAGGRGDDLLYAGSAATAAADLDDGAVAANPGGGDLLSGGDGDDTIVGDAEGNLIEGGAGSDHIYGGAGDDWIGGDVSVLASREYYPVGNPADQTSSMTLLPSTPSAFSLSGGGVGTALLAKISGTAVPNQDMTNPLGGDDRIEAAAGNDAVFAGGGDDIVFGGSGDDYVHAGTGKDTVIAGVGDDFIDASQDALGDYIDAGDGSDAVYAGGGDDVVIGGRGDDFIYSFGAGSDILIGGEGRDRLSGIGGGDVLDGGPGDDLLSVGYSLENPVNRIRLGRGYGADTAFIGGGALVIEVAGDVAPSEITIRRTEREFEMRLWPSGDVARTFRLPGVEIALGSGTDSLFFLEGLEDYGVAGTLMSVEFADGTVWDDAYFRSLLNRPGAPAAARPIAGTGGAELIYGTAGADILSGALGDDWLAGDAGDDTYVYALGDGFDVIEDSGNADALRFGSGILAQEVGVFASGSDYILTAGAGGVRLRGGRTAEGAIERIEFADGSLWLGADLAARAEMLPDNRAPRMPATLGSVAVAPGAQVEVAIPRAAISDPDRFDALSFYAITADGERLPEWLHFDASSLKVSGTPTAADAGTHEVLLIAADASGAAAHGSLTILVGGDGTVPRQGGEVPQATAADAGGGLTIPVGGNGTVPQLSEATPQPVAPPAQPTGAVLAADVPAAPTVPAQPRFGEAAAAPQPVTPPAQPASAVVAADVPVARTVPAQPRFEEAAAAPVALPTRESPVPGDAADPVFRDIQHRFDVLLQTGRHNLGERYAEAVREFEERRLLREEAPTPPLTDEEVEAWNSAMHAWHERNPGFAETDLGGNDGTWTMGWGSPGAGERTIDGAMAVGDLPGLANPNALSRLQGAAAAPSLGEGMRDIR